MKTSMNLQVITPQVTTEITNLSDYCYIYRHFSSQFFKFIQFSRLFYFWFSRPFSSLFKLTFREVLKFFQTKHPVYSPIFEFGMSEFILVTIIYANK